MKHVAPMLAILWASMLTVAQGQQLCSILDISYAIVMDSSSSVTDEEWIQQKTFVKNFVAQTNLGSTSRVKVAIINYGSDSVIAANCDSASTSSLAAFNSFIDTLPKQNGGTAINSALNDVITALGRNGCGRLGESKVMLFLTDGKENVILDDSVRLTTEESIRAQTDARLIVAIGSDADLAGLNRITGNPSQVRSQNSFQELESIDNSVLWPELVTQFCDVGGVWTSWGAYGACSVTCGGAGIESRTRECQNPVNSQLRTDCPGSGTESRTCNTGDCTGSLSNWGVFSACTETCQSNVNVIPTQTRTRQCIGATGSGNCGGATLVETVNCQAGVPCPGTWGAWSTYSTCSETCQSNVNAAPTQTRTRPCNPGTFNGGCTSLPGGSAESRSCNAGVGCPGVLSNWGPFGACSATCQLGLLSPTRTRNRQCVGATFGVLCTTQPLTESTDCNTEVACPGTLTQWSAFSVCSETCQSNILTPPTYTRSRSCIQTSFGGNCNGQPLTDTQPCNANVACPGIFGQWSVFGACSHTCNFNPNTPPTQTRTRTCSGGTFGGGCAGSTVESVSCNVNVDCPGQLTEWGLWSGCSATCQIGLQSPTRTRTRLCQLATGLQNCNSAQLTQVESCSTEVACPGTLSEWSQWSTCPRTCIQQGETAPSQIRTRACTGFSFGGSCGGASTTDTRVCGNSLCVGTLTLWSQWSACSATCREGNVNPTRTRVRTCAGGVCSFPLTETENCNTDLCPLFCNVDKRCTCQSVTQYSVAPTIATFGLSEEQIDTAVKVMEYWTPEIQNQTCESCSIPRLTTSVDTVNSHIAQVDAVRQLAEQMKVSMRDIVNCNGNLDISMELWKLYDYIWERCTLLKGVSIELAACKKRFDAALESCQSYTWIHRFMKNMFRKY